VAGRVLRLEAKPFGNVAERVSDDASYDFGVFRICLPDCDIHLASAAFYVGHSVNPLD
jgi:hypothetical protein